MGIKFVPRGRMESLPAIPDQTLAALGADDINFEKYDESEVYRLMNQQLDTVQTNANIRTGYFGTDNIIGPTK